MPENAQGIGAAILDKSSSVRGLVTSTLQENVQGLSVVHSGDSYDGLRRALEKDALGIQLLILDVDLQDKDGSLMVEELLKDYPHLNIIVLSEPGGESALRSAKAMKKGAREYLVKVKPTESKEKSAQFLEVLVAKVLTLFAAMAQVSAIKESAAAPTILAPKDATVFNPDAEYELVKKPLAFMPKVLAIASSTGGPKALADVFLALKGKGFRAPVFITQHMPKDFTPLFAKQIGSSVGLDAFEAQDGQEVVEGGIYIAPGDYHMGVEKRDEKVFIKLNQNPPENFCRPAADPMMRSLIEVYGAQKILMLVMTGMGQDGLEGGRELVKKGGMIIAQDRETSVVWGMPGAVTTNNLVHKLYPLKDVAGGLVEHMAGRIA